ncbi:MAG: TIGR03936 family radical SAM-associated protein, partial [Syntrophorhabdaceae bacterium]|nr:TIGR03936 family radical SAM-associated protein [Syntrophorhabdaceae bacterium]
EYFDFEKYRTWFDKNELDMTLFIGGRQPNSPLPWDFIDTGIDKAYLMDELSRAHKGIYTENCYSGCASCGLLCERHFDIKKVTKIEFIKEHYHINTKVSETYKKVSLRYGKFGNTRYIGHLDTMNILLRAFKACEIYIKTHGKFHPMPKITMTDALPVGVESACEFIEIEVDENTKIDKEMLKRINSKLPAGMKIYESRMTTIKDIKNDFIYLLVCDADFENESAEMLFKRNKKVFYCLKTERIKEFLKYDKIKRIIKIEEGRINAFRAHN